MNKLSEASALAGSGIRNSKLKRPDDTPYYEKLINEAVS